MGRAIFKPEDCGVQFSRILYPVDAEEPLASFKEYFPVWYASDEILYASSLPKCLAGRHLILSGKNEL